MHTFAQESKATQQTTSAKSAIPGCAHFRQSREMNPTPHLQRTIGNQAVQYVLQTNAEELETGSPKTAPPRVEHNFSRIPLHSHTTGAIQAKPAINTFGDEYEQEADRIAEQVVRMPDPQLQRACACDGECLKGHAEQLGQEGKRLQTKRIQSNGTRQIGVPPIVHEVLADFGQPLDMATHSFMEPRFGQDLSRVRLHAGERAAESARAVGARAYTVGMDIVFGDGEYASQTSYGRKLLAHELAHVVQQQTGSVRLARKRADYVTGKIAARTGWTFVAYLDQGLVRLGFRVTDQTPDQRIGNIGWITHNPGSLDLATPTIPDPKDPSKKIPAPPAQRVAVKHGAYEKNPTDIKTYRRFAIFPSQRTGEAAIYPMLEVLARNNKNPTVDGLLRIYVGGSAAHRANYVVEIRRVLKPIYHRQLELTNPDMPEAERAKTAASLTEGLMARHFLDVDPGSWDAQYILEAVLKVESTRDLARVGLEYSCSGGFRNEAMVRRIYASAPWKIKEIDALVGSAAAKAQLESVLGCKKGRMA